MRRIPVFLAFVPLILILYVLAWLPGVNTLLLKAKMPFWPIVIVNLGLLGLVAEIFVRRLPKLWLALPLLWFGGYGVMAWLDRQAVEELRVDTKVANAVVNIPFQPAEQSLVFANGKPDESLIQNYGLKVLYSSDANKSAGFIAVRMMQADICDNLRNQPPSPAGILTKGFHEESEGFTKGPFEKRFCMVSMPEQPGPRRLVITSAEKDDVYRGIPVSYTDLTFEYSRTADERLQAEQTAIVLSAAERQKSLFKLRSGFASPLGWFPMPILAFGTMTTNAVPAFRFRRSRYVPLNTEAGQFTSGTATIARALGLKRINPADRQAGASPDMQALITASELATTLDETARLDRVLGDIQANIGDAPFNSLLGRLDIIQPRVEKIVAAVEVGIAEQNRGGRNAWQLFQMLKRVPAAQIAPYRVRIDTYQLQDPRFKL